jgi:hypothetical protein
MVIEFCFVDEGHKNKLFLVLRVTDSYMAEYII